MGRKWNPEGVPDDTRLPRMAGIFEIDEIPEGEANGKLVYKPSFTCVEPKAYKGKKLFGVTWWIGSDEDPDANDPETWAAASGAISLKQCITAAGVKPSRDIDADREAVVGRQVGIVVGRKARKNDPDRIDNTAGSFFKVGTRAVEVFDDEGAPKAKAPASKPAPKAPTRDEAEEDEAAADEAFAQPPPKAIKPTKVTETTGTPTPKKVSKGEKMPCPQCGVEVARKDMLDHLDTHDDEGDADD